MRLTLRDLGERGACCGSLSWFKHYFPDGVDISRARLDKVSPEALQRMSSSWVSWMVDLLLPPDRAEGYFSDENYDERLRFWGSSRKEERNRTALRQFIELTEGLTEWRKS